MTIMHFINMEKQVESSLLCGFSPTSPPAKSSFPQKRGTGKVTVGLDRIKTGKLLRGIAKSKMLAVLRHTVFI